MANPNFSADYSTNQIYIDQDQTECLTDVLDEMESDIDGKAESDHTHTGFANENHTHTEYAPSEHTHTEYASATHDHDANYISKSLQFTKDNGDVEFSFGSNSGKNILTEINSWPIGFHTAYAISGTDGNPTEDSFRYIVHKTGANIGWVIAFSGQGDVYSNYVHNGVYCGWKRLDSGSDAPLWSGSYYMAAEHVVTPSKKLSECNKGWTLVWSDYDADTSTVNSYDQCVCTITKKNAMGNNWNGEGYMCVLPCYSDDDSAAESILVKSINVYDNRLVGKDKNKVGDARRDVVLRAIYEF